MLGREARGAREPIFGLLQDFFYFFFPFHKERKVQNLASRAPRDLHHHYFQIKFIIGEKRVRINSNYITSYQELSIPPGWQIVAEQ